MLKFILPALLALSLPAQAQSFTLSEDAADALIAVVAHEMGHAVIREFDLPVLGPEEDMAEDFAVLFTYMMLPDRAEAIVTARARQHLADNQDAAPFSEYRGDVNRAQRNICLLYGQDPERFSHLAEAFGMNERARNNCRDFPTEVARSWRRTLAPLMLPEGARVTEVGTRFDSSDARVDAFRDSAAMEASLRLLTAIDWHSRITLNIAQCDGTAGWSRNGRQIRLCSAYIERFERQLGR